MSDHENLKKILSGMFSSSGKLSRGYNQYTMEQVWRETFGTMISSYTTSVKFYKGTLTVFITSSPLKQELSSTKEVVIEKMNRNLQYNKVTALIIR